MIEIKDGQVKILCIPVNKKTDRIVDILGIEIAEQVLNTYKLTTILGKFTELSNEDCEKIVEWSEFDEDHKLYYNYVTDHWLHNPKVSLESLLKSNGCMIKYWTTEPRMNHWGASMEDYNQYYEDMKEYDALPEDYLILTIDII